MEILENMSAREQRYNVQEALERIWNDSGDEEDFDSDENDDESYELASEDKSDESEDASSSNEHNIVQDFAESSGDKASAEGDGGNQVNRARQRPPRQHQAPLVWRMAHGTTPRDIPFTGNSGVQVQTVGFEPHDYFVLFIDDDLLNCFVLETNRYAAVSIAEGNLKRRSRANDWARTAGQK